MKLIPAIIYTIFAILAALKGIDCFHAKNLFGFWTCIAASALMFVVGIGYIVAEFEPKKKHLFWR